MPTRNVFLTPSMDEFVTRCVKSGRYSSASEVVRSALRLMADREVHEPDAANGTPTLGFREKTGA